MPAPLVHGDIGLLVPPLVAQLLLHLRVRLDDVVHSRRAGEDRTVDDAHPVFRDHAHEFTVEALGFFYLATQYINIDTSFWRPYLECLPEPETLNTPFWFDDADLQWLAGSDVYQAYVERERVWRQYWEDGLKVIARAGVDTDPYTWSV